LTDEASTPCLTHGRRHSQALSQLLDRQAGGISGGQQR